MRLRRLRIDRLPGITPGFELTDLAPGVNLISGPNASGKSSLIRALRHLLAGPAPDDPALLSLDAEFGNGGTWTVSRQGPAVQWQHDGRDAPPPRLPDAAALSGYWLTMENLLSKDATDADLEAELYRTLTGGFDLSGVRRALFEVRPLLGQREYRDLLKARDALREQVGESRALKRDEDALPDLRQRVAEARAAAERVKALQQAIEWLDLLEQQRALEAKLGSYPAAMARLRGNELEQLDALEADLAKADEAIRSARQRQAEARQALEDTGLADGLPTEAELATQTEALRQLRELAKASEETQEALQAALSAEATVRQLLGGQNPDQELSPTPALLQRAEQLSREQLLAQKRCIELSAQIDELPEAIPEPQLRRLQQGAEALRAWLSVAALSQEWPWGALTAVLGGALAAVAASLHELWLAATGGLIAMAGGGLAWWQGRVRSGKPQADFVVSGLPAPEGWTVASVRERCDAIESELAAARANNERVAQQARLAEQLAKVQREAEALTAEQQALANEIGMDPGQGVLNFDLFLRHLAQFQEARTQRDTLQRRLAAQAEKREVLEKSLRGFLARWGEPVSADISALTAGLEALQRRCRDARAASEKVTEGGREEVLARERHAEKTGEIQGLYTQAGLDEGDRAKLLTCLNQHEDWQQLSQRQQQLTGLIGGIRAALVEESHLIEQVEQGERASLQEQLAAEQRVAESLSELTVEVGRVSERLEQAGRDNKLEQTQATVDQQQDKLADALDTCLLGYAGQFLLDEVSAAYHQAHEPELLREGRSRFQRFTHHAWDLALDSADGLLAIEQASQRRHRLAELSTGTRMQLLLAMRTARLAHLEQGREALPLFLDEALTTSDEARFAAVAGALHVLASGENRQVFYLSARRQELALWQSLTGEQPRHIDLAAVRFAHATAAEDLQVAPLVAVPEPGDLSAEDYGVRLAVPPVDPRLADGQLHLFHLLRDDLSLLHRLLSDWRVETLGQLEALLASDAAANAIPDSSVRAQLAARIALARRWLAAWRQGRGRPVDRAVLAASGAVSDAFIEQTSALAGQLGGDGVALLEALRSGEVPRFRKDKIEELETWLEEAGYVDAAPVLDAEARLQQTLLGASDCAQSGTAVQQLVSWLESGTAASPATH
jgi:DNA repair protein SbcC/Rad50